VRFAQISAHTSLPDENSEPMSFQISRSLFIANFWIADYTDKWFCLTMAGS
jgi:hypothetical protein